MQTKRKDFIAYDYKEVHTESDKVSLFLDGYECFGWELDAHVPISPMHTHGVSSAERVILRLRRNRKIMNKMELTRLQRNYEACVKEIDVLEKRKRSKALVMALGIGLLGTAFMAGSVFAVTAQPPIIWLCVLLAIPAFTGWLLPLFIYRKVVQEQTEYLNPMIEAKYDEIYELCEKGNKIRWNGFE